jgi:hypothetical protein
MKLDLVVASDKNLSSVTRFSIQLDSSDSIDYWLYPRLSIVLILLRLHNETLIIGRFKVTQNTQLFWVFQLVGLLAKY